MNVRAGRPEDAEAVGRLHIATWRTAYRDLLPPARLAALDPEEAVRRHRGRLLTPPDPDWRHWVVEEDGAVRGFCVTGKTRDEDEPAGTFELYAIYVLEAWAGRGLGRALWKTAVDEMRCQGAREVTLWVIAANEVAVRFYEAAGFRRDDRAPARLVSETDVPEARYRLRLGGGGTA